MYVFLRVYVEVRMRYRHFGPRHQFGEPVADKGTLDANRIERRKLSYRTPARERMFPSALVFVKAIRFNDWWVRRPILG